MKLYNEVTSTLDICKLNFISLFIFSVFFSFRVVQCCCPPVFPLPSLICSSVCHLVRTLRFTSHVQYIQYITEARSLFQSFYVIIRSLSGLNCKLLSP